METGAEAMTASLDPMPYVVDTTAADPILCNHELNLELAALAASRLDKPNPAMRSVILSAPMTTRADTLAVLAILESGDDPELAAHLLQCLHSYLSAA